jgi:hypothetical protein
MTPLHGWGAWRSIMGERKAPNQGKDWASAPVHSRLPRTPGCPEGMTVVRLVGEPGTLMGSGFTVIPVDRSYDHCDPTPGKG